MDAACIRTDNVLSRLSILDCLSFVYHVTNECYKGYTLAKALEQIQVSNEVEDVNMLNLAILTTCHHLRWKGESWVTFLKQFDYIFKRKKEM